MGIDPVTHKPLPIETDQSQTQQKQPQNQPLQQQEQDKQNLPSLSQNPKFEPESDQTKEPEEKEMSHESSAISEEKDEDKMISLQFDTSMEVMNGFCTDEVPIIEPPEILVPCAPSCSSSSSSSSSNSSNFLEDLLLPEFDWPCNYNNNNDINVNKINNMALWDDDFVGSWDLLITDDEGDKKQLFDAPLIQ